MRILVAAHGVRGGNPVISNSRGVVPGTQYGVLTRKCRLQNGDTWFLFDFVDEEGEIEKFMAAEECCVLTQEGVS